MALIKCKECGQKMSQQAERCPACGHPNKVATYVSKKTTFIAFLVLAGFIWAVIRGGTDSGPTAPSPTDAALAAVTLKDVSWYKDGFDAIMMLDATIDNAGDRAVKDVEIECEHTSPSGTVIDRNTKTIYEIVPAYDSLKLKDFNMGFIHSQVDATACRITDLVAM